MSQRTGEERATSHKSGKEHAQHNRFDRLSDEESVEDIPIIGAGASTSMNNAEYTGSVRGGNA